MSDGPRLPDIARESGMSLATVSRVLGARGRVSEASARKVWAAVETLGYARSTLLARSEAVLVGLRAPEQPETWQLDALYLLRRHILRSGTFPVALPASPGGDETEADAGGVAAVIHPDFTVGRSRDPIARIGLVDSSHPAPAGRPGGRERSVEVGVGAGMAKALEHLRFLGHRRIGLITGGDPALAEILREAFRGSHPGALVVPDLARWMVGESPTTDGGRRAARALLDATCTAVICQSPAAALGVVAEAGEHRMAVPRDVSVVTLGDGVQAQFSAPPLTALRLDPAVLASAFAAVLDHALSGEAGPGVPGVPVELVVRASTGPARTGG